MSLPAVLKAPDRSADGPCATMARIPASLASLPKEIFQEIALCYALFCVSALEDEQKEILVPASLQAPLPASCGNPGPHYDPMLRWQTRWQDGARVASCTPQASCHSPSGMLSGQSQFCYRRSPASHDSPAFALLSICRKLRNQLLGSHAFWSHVALMLPYFLPRSLEWIRVQPGSIPVRLECWPGLCQCTHVFPMIQQLLQHSGHVSLRIPAWDDLAGKPTSDLIKRELALSSVIQSLELRFDSATQFLVRQYEYATFPNLETFRAINATFFAIGRHLRRFNLAIETPDLAVPVNILADALAKCRMLQEITLQFALRDPETPPNHDGAQPLRSIVLPELEFLLICDSIENYMYLWDRMIIPNQASVHADIVMRRALQKHDLLQFAVADAAWNCLGWDGFPPCKYVILDYHAMEPNFDAAWPEYIRLTFAGTEAEVWAERDPRQTARRCSFTVRFQTTALMRRYPPDIGGDFSYKARLKPGSAFNGFLSGFDVAVDLSAVEVFIQKSGGRAQSILDNKDALRKMPNLRTLVLYGVCNPIFVSVRNLVEELARWGQGPSLEGALPLECVRLPDWDHATAAWGAWNEEIRARNPNMECRPDILWSK